MKNQFVIAILTGLFCFLDTATAHPPSTLVVRTTGEGAMASAGSHILIKSSIETFNEYGSPDQFLVLSTEQTRCVISKQSAAKQGVTIEMLNDLANRYQVEVTCVYSYPLKAGQLAANNFGFRASMR